MNNAVPLTTTGTAALLLEHFGATILSCGADAQLSNAVLSFEEKFFDLSSEAIELAFRAWYATNIDTSDRLAEAMEAARLLRVGRLLQNTPTGWAWVGAPHGS